MASTPSPPLEQGKTIKVDSRVEVTGKGLIGTVKYIGMTAFSTGKWIGVELDEPKGKNDGTVQGKRYFECPANHGIFIRQSQLSLIQETSGRETPRSSLPKPSLSGTQSSIPTPGSGLPTPRSRGLLRPGFAGKEKTSDDVKDETSTETPSLTPAKPVFATTAKDQEPPTPISNVSHIAEEPSPLSVSSIPSGRSGIASEEVLELQRKLIEKEKAVLDLEEKLNTLKARRIEDKAKLKEHDKMKMQIQQLADYKVKWQENQKELLNQMRQAQKDASEAKAQLAKHDDDVQELNEAVEMATLDKEMAEEKYESLLSENESLKEHVEELSLELEILKREISDGGIESVTATAHVKQYEQQNARLKEAIIKLKEMSTADKADVQNLQKQVKELSNQVTSLSNEREKLTDALQAAESSIDELKEQVDTALGAEEMVETLTDKNLALEEQVEELKETIADLEAIRDLNEELEENHVQTEHDIREELDLTQNKVREAERRHQAAQQTISDYQDTISKFRDLVANLQNRIRDLQHSQEADNEKEEETKQALDIDFKIKFAEIKQHAKTIEMELKKFEVQEMTQHVKMLNSFFPDHFSKRGGDYDGVLLLLLFERMKFKTELLSSQIRDKLGISEVVDSGEALEGPKGDQISCAAYIMYRLAHFNLIISRYLNGADNCDVNTFIRVAGQYPELAVHERILDHFINLLSKDQSKNLSLRWMLTPLDAKNITKLDSSVSTEQLDKSINVFEVMYKLHLASHPVSCTDYLVGGMEILTAGTVCLSVDVQRLKALGQNCDEASKFMKLLGDIELRNMEVKQLCKKIKRRMPQESNYVLSYPPEVRTALSESLYEQNLLVKMVQDLSSVIGYKASALADGEHLLSGQLEETACDCATLTYQKDDLDPDTCVSQGFSKILDCLSGFAIKLQEGAYDQQPPTSQQIRPYLLRAQIFKEELSTTTKLEEKIASREMEIMDLRKTIRGKAEELSEANIRIGLLEKRADNAAKEADGKVEQMTKKLEQRETDFKKEKSNYEQTMDVLQADIDALDSENSMLKKRVEAYSKKSFLTDMAKHVQSQSPIAGIVGSGVPAKRGGAMRDLANAGVAGATPSVQVIIKDSPVILAQVDALRTALRHLKLENIRLKGQVAKKPTLRESRRKAELKSLPKIFTMPESVTETQVNASNDEAEKINPIAVAKETDELLENLQKLSASPRVVDISRRQPGIVPVSKKSTPITQLIQAKDVLFKLRKQQDELQNKIRKVVANEISGSSIESSCSNFFSPEYAKVVKERGNPVYAGKISIPLATMNKPANVHRINVSSQELQSLHLVMVK